MQRRATQIRIVNSTDNSSLARLTQPSNSYEMPVRFLEQVLTWLSDSNARDTHAPRETAGQMRNTSVK